MREVGPVERMERKRYSCRVLVGNPEGNRFIGVDRRIILELILKK
jgi:hypothetical protein